MLYNPPPSGKTPMTRKRSKPKAGRKSRKSRITKLAPNQAAARDEGPRLIPLRKPQDPPKIDHWVELADRALKGPDRKKGSG